MPKFERRKNQKTENVNFFSKILFGEENKYNAVPLNKYRFDKDQLVYSVYNEEKDSALEKTINIADVVFPLAYNSEIITKSGIMLGLGEEKNEVINVMKDLSAYKCDYMTLGQYMQPTRDSYPVFRYLNPEEFTELKQIGLEIGFKKVFSGALVRSSYHAKEFYEG